MSQACHWMDAAYFAAARRRCGWPRCCGDSIQPMLLLPPQQPYQHSNVNSLKCLPRPRRSAASRQRAHCRPCVASPRCCARAGSSQTMRAASTDDLPDEVLIQALALLSEKERCESACRKNSKAKISLWCAQPKPSCRPRRRSLPAPPLAPATSLPRCRLRSAGLVSKRFAALSCSPELLRSVDVGRLIGVSAVQSLTAWLARHGKHVRELSFDCYDPYFGHRLWDVHEEEAVTEAAVAACMTAAGTAGQLADLAASGIRSTDWLSALRSLRQLCLSSDSISVPLRISPAISSLTALTSLSLYGDPIAFEAGAQLPASIEELCLSDSKEGIDEQAS